MGVFSQWAQDCGLLCWSIIWRNHPNPRANIVVCSIFGF